MTWVEREARRIDKARALIRAGIPGPGGLWADLGCGDGIFTAALHTFTRPGATIYAVDRDARSLAALQRHFAESFSDADLRPLPGDFTEPLELPPLDGILVANALHFERDAHRVMAHIAGWLKPGARLIVVEYNTTRGNSAVPHPIDEHHFLQIANAIGLREARILARIPSTFLGEMYAGMALA
jgi:SAM-dependent methyltransferase